MQSAGKSCENSSDFFLHKAEGSSRRGRRSALPMASSKKCGVGQSTCACSYFQYSPLKHLLVRIYLKCSVLRESKRFFQSKQCYDSNSLTYQQSFQSSLGIHSALLVLKVWKKKNSHMSMHFVLFQPPYLYVGYPGILWLFPRYKLLYSYPFLRGILYSPSLLLPASTNSLLLQLSRL